MRHGRKVNHLGRKTGHRKSMLSNMASSLVLHKRITTTLAKARELRKFVEPLITKSKNDNTHNRRIVFSYLKNKYAVTELFREISVKVADRPGGYTRIIKLGNRLGDNSDMAMIELVDYNTLYTNEKPAKKTRRGRRGGNKAKASASESNQTSASSEIQSQIENTAADTSEAAPTTTTETEEPGKE
ncbi:MAG: 50S ribosomal protein L17 [Thermaurantimonas sp.]